MSIATAVLLSSGFLLLHAHYYPFRSMSCNRLQSYSLTIQALMYFSGLLVKTETLGPADAEHLGYLLATLIITVFVLTALAIRSELRSSSHALKSGWRVGQFVGKHAHRDTQQLQKVLAETRAMLKKRIPPGTAITVTSFRRGGRANRKHEFLHRVQACLEDHPFTSSSDPPAPAIGYVHYQSGYENSLFGWRSADQTVDGDAKDVQLESGETYYGLNMPACW